MGVTNTFCSINFWISATFHFPSPLWGQELSQIQALCTLIQNPRSDRVKGFQSYEAMHNFFACFLDPEVAEMLLWERTMTFLDPEIIEIVKFLDQELVKNYHKSFMLQGVPSKMSKTICLLFGLGNNLYGDKWPFLNYICTFWYQV